MRRVLLLGAGKIGRMIAKLLAASGDYDVVLGDVDPPALERADHHGVRTSLVNARCPCELAAAMADRDCVVSALSYHFNAVVAQAALEAGISYFDLTEDIDTTRRVRELAESAAPGQIFMPQ